VTRNYRTGTEMDRAETAASNGNGLTPAADLSSADLSSGELGELLDRVGDTALRFLAAAPSPPLSLRMQAGKVSVDVEWDGNEPRAATVPDPGTAPTPEARSAETEPQPSGGYLTAQTVGVFYHAPEPGAAPFVTVGDAVVPGQQVGLIEAMKLMIPVEADRGGLIAAVLKANGEPVEYAERLFALSVIEPV
jgi:acetyl-CoA carboxylase biotin carboxyl carrier protein